MASLVRFRYSLPGCLPPCTDQTGILPQPPGTFTSRLSTDRSPSPLLDITTTATGLLCWRDLHPLEWQLASLHGHELPRHLTGSAAEVPSTGDTGRPQSRARRKYPRNSPRRYAIGAAEMGQLQTCEQEKRPPTEVAYPKIGVLLLFEIGHGVPDDHLRLAAISEQSIEFGGESS